MTESLITRIYVYTESVTTCKEAVILPLIAVSCYERQYGLSNNLILKSLKAIRQIHWKTHLAFLGLQRLLNCTQLWHCGVFHMCHTVFLTVEEASTF